MLRVPYKELRDALLQPLLKLGLEPHRAVLCAQLFAEASRDGVSSHGLNRFPLFVSMIRNGIVKLHAQPELLASFGSMQRWDGKFGPGNLNAYHCMAQAIALAHEHGVGCVALSNTNHWMRGGAYGWQAADAGVIGICWTNTLPNLPPWGASDPRLGNNPLVIAVPHPNGHVVLDMAMSQFSFGALASYRMRGELLPVDGGFDVGGRLTRVPEEIEASKRPLPIGYWKGSGLALMLDLIAGTLSGGRTTHQIEPPPERETGLSQIFLAFDPSCFGSALPGPTIAEQVIAHLKLPRAGGAQVRYPGEHTLKIRTENLEKGVPVEPSIWRQVQAL
ncbi:MAG: 3-dehydro-L-gulonate 2-dehydrogenase [Candidatus Acidiferrum sp.]